MVVPGEVVETSSLRELVTPETPLSLCPTSLNLADPKQAALAVSVMGVADMFLDQTGKAVIKATNYLIYGDYITREDGSGSDPVVFVCLIDRDGRVFKTTGVYAPRAIRAAAELYSQKEWDEGITFIISERQTKDRRIAHDIRIVIDAEDTTGPSA